MSDVRTCPSCKGGVAKDVVWCRRCEKGVCEPCFNEYYMVCDRCSKDNDVCLACGAISSGVSACTVCNMRECKTCVDGCKFWKAQQSK